MDDGGQGGGGAGGDPSFSPVSFFPYMATSLRGQYSDSFPEAMILRRYSLVHQVLWATNMYAQSFGAYHFYNLYNVHIKCNFYHLCFHVSEHIVDFQPRVDGEEVQQGNSHTVRYQILW